MPEKAIEKCKPDFILNTNALADFINAISEQSAWLRVHKFMTEKINNQSKKQEKREPQDSEHKEIHHPQNDKVAVVKPEDQEYRQENADFENPARNRERSEQPIESVTKEPKK